MQPYVDSAQAPSPRILIVEDSEPLRLALRGFICATIVPCTCVEASSGEYAVAVAVAMRPAVVVMDLMLPGINGIEASRRIKSVLPRIPIVMVSLHEEAKFQDEAKLAGITAYVPKRVLHRELIPLLKSLLEGALTQALVRQAPEGVA